MKSPGSTDLPIPLRIIAAQMRSIDPALDGGETMPHLTTDATRHTSSRTLPTRSVIRLLLSRAAFVATLLAASSVLASEVIHRGAPIPSGGKVIPLGSVISKPKAFTQEEFVTEGTVRKVCFFAGCWMSIAPDDSSPAMHVTFKGGAFVVPRFSSGNHARLLGKVRVKDDKATFVASGVDMTESK
jgi:hypothetical protein